MIDVIIDKTGDDKESAVTAKSSVVKKYSIALATNQDMEISIKDHRPPQH